MNICNNQEKPKESFFKPGNLYQYKDYPHIFISLPFQAFNKCILISMIDGNPWNTSGITTPDGWVDVTDEYCLQKV